MDEGFWGKERITYISPQIVSIIKLALMESKLIITCIHKFSVGDGDKQITSCFLSNPKSCNPGNKPVPTSSLLERNLGLPGCGGFCFQKLCDSLIIVLE